MNLYTPGDGLFGTHVTWTDIEEDLQRELDTQASFGPNKSAEDIGEGKGFMSRIVLIYPDWQQRDRKLPEKFIVKIVTQLAMQKFTTDIAKAKNINNNFSDPAFMVKFEKLQKKCHNTEVAVYTQLEKIPGEKKRAPKVFYMRKFSENNPVKGYIIMEYLEDAKGVHVFENITPEQVKQILHYKAVLEAMSLDIPLERRSEFIDNPFEAFFGSMFKQEVLDNMMTMFRSFEGGRLADKAEHLGKIIANMIDLRWADNLADEFGMERVLCHGDMWSMNILWRAGKNGELDLAAVVDYQHTPIIFITTLDTNKPMINDWYSSMVIKDTGAVKFISAMTAHFGCAATDIVRMLCACLSGRDRRAHWEELLEEFYGYLKAEVGKRRMPYSMEQLKESYRRYFPLGSFMIVPMIGPLFEVIFKNPDEDIRKKCIETVVEKTECLLEDMFYYHDRNCSLKNAELVI